MNLTLLYLVDMFQSTVHGGNYYKNKRAVKMLFYGSI